MSIWRELRALARSFGFALRGICYGIRTQRNLRIHVVALLTVVIFNRIAQLSVIHWCVELLCCMLVISLELVNTALEAACDKFSTERHPLIGHAKDAAAGAVLIAAIGAVVIALLIYFYGGDYPEHTKAFFAAHGHGWVKPSLLVGYILAAGFVFLPSVIQKQKTR